MEKDLPIYTVSVDEHDDETGMFVISFVDKPAMQIQGIALSEETTIEEIKLQSDDEMTFTSAIIIPNKLIYRNTPTERYIQFKAEDVKKIRDKFFRKTGELRFSNMNHNSDDIVDAFMIESWIIRDPKTDTALSYGFTDLPAGTLMGTFKVNDRKFWEEHVKTGNIGGFSLEAIFKETKLELSENVLESFSDEEFGELISLLSKVLK
jgi:hypothetical protein